MKQFKETEIADVLLEHTYEDRGCACGVTMHKLSNRDPGARFLMHLSEALASNVNNKIKEESEGEDAAARFEEKFIAYIQAKGLVTRVRSGKREGDPPSAQIIAFGGDIYRRYKEDFDAILTKIIKDKQKEQSGIEAIKNTFKADGGTASPIVNPFGVTNSIVNDLEAARRKLEELQSKSFESRRHELVGEWAITNASPASIARQIVTGANIAYSEVPGTGPRANIYVDKNGAVYGRIPLPGDNPRRRNAGWPGIERDS